MRKLRRLMVKKYAKKYKIGISALWKKYQVLGLKNALKWYGVRV